jgi:hypothetical protein
MDPKTGEVTAFQTRAELQAEQSARRVKGLGPLIELGQLPKPSCRKCFGTGISGRNVTTGDVVPCPCTRRRRSR